MNTPPEAESDMRDPGMSSAHMPGTSPVLGGGDRAGASAAGEAELSTPPAAAASSPSSRQPDGAPPPPAEAESTQEQPPPEQNGGDALPVGDSSAPITSASALFGGEAASAPDALFRPFGGLNRRDPERRAFTGEATTDAAALFGGLPAERTSGFPATPVSPSGAPPFGSPAAATAEPLDDVRSAVSPNSKNASTTNEAASEADVLTAQGVVPSESQVSPTNVASAPPTEEAASLFPSETVSGDLFGSTSALAPDHSAEPFTGAPDPEPAAALFGAPQLDQAAAPFASAPAPVGSFVDSAGDRWHSCQCVVRRTGTVRFAAGRSNGRSNGACPSTICRRVIPFWRAGFKRVVVLRRRPRYRGCAILWCANVDLSGGPVR